MTSQKERKTDHMFWVTFTPTMEQVEILKQIKGWMFSDLKTCRNMEDLIRILDASQGLVDVVVSHDQASDTNLLRQYDNCLVMVIREGNTVLVYKSSTLDQIWPKF